MQAIQSDTLLERPHHIIGLKERAGNLTCHGTDRVCVTTDVQHPLQPAHASFGAGSTPNGHNSRVHATLTEANQDVRAPLDDKPSPLSDSIIVKIGSNAQHLAEIPERSWMSHQLGLRRRQVALRDERVQEGVSSVSLAVTRLQEFSKSSTRIDIAVLKLVQACSALLPCRALQHKTADVLAAFQLFFMDSTEKFGKQIRCQHRGSLTVSAAQHLGSRSCSSHLEEHLRRHAHNSSVPKRREATRIVSTAVLLCEFEEIFCGPVVAIWLKQLDL
mmetsp:Transcript_3039/g.7209  ORF Transcript_3039/g.7209 Transcript_3039/m.7209 type:complete len:274 (-) Transcript_3039:473-1294(-)